MSSMKATGECVGRLYSDRCKRVIAELGCAVISGAKTQPKLKENQYGGYGSKIGFEGRKKYSVYSPSPPTDCMAYIYLNRLGLQAIFKFRFIACTHVRKCPFCAAESVNYVDISDYRSDVAFVTECIALAR